MKQDVVHLIEDQMKSPPARGRGLKPYRPARFPGHPAVAPRAGAWIETKTRPLSPVGHSVAPRAGAWIETIVTGGATGLLGVAPRAGAWIETLISTTFDARNSCRPPRGGVD